MRQPSIHRNAGILLLIFLLAACSDSNPSGRSPAERISPLPVLHDKEALDEVVRTAGQRLLLFDLYADWCAPCKELEPLLEEIAWEKRQVADVYRINIDQNQGLATFFEVSAIPVVVYVKEGTIVHRVTGLRAKKDYLAAIRSFTQP